MYMRMLVDAAHPEETRVVVTRGNRLEAFEFESSNKKQLKGNIYLAKVTRVEPSLQAAFVDYGGNRHGFLAFNEIHPDYYQIPVEDREVLLDQDKDGQDTDGDDSDDPSENGNSEKDAGTEAQAESQTVAETVAETVEGVESLGGEDEIDEDIKRRSRVMKRYRIQEVIKRRQIILIQVVKEERGSKGAALTSYLSLAGRYCVLMPNTARGGGISRKIANPADRKRLKGIASNLDVPDGMGVIIRTAGLNRTKPEIKRDYDYLLRTWNKVRDLTLESSAPCLVHEEGDLIKRAIRDLYKKEIDEILVSGDAGYRSAKDFMKTLMPSQAKVVQPYRGSVPLFHKYQVEREIDDMYSPRVTLKSGAYLIINPTEALVAIDVNSGRSTKERNVEETAYRTNLEAAEEIARQVRLRDLAGLIVIDFIDMEVSRNVRAVEAKMKECLEADRARIQVGRISSFGLMEMSRQRLRPDLVEASTNLCPSCGGAGVVRSTESTALAVLRSVDDEGTRGNNAAIIINAPPEVAIYILNQKRTALLELEQRYSFQIEIRVDDSLLAPNFKIVRYNISSDGVKEEAASTPPPSPSATAETDGDDEERGSDRKRRRKRRRRPRRDGESGNGVAGTSDSDTGTVNDPETKQPEVVEAKSNGSSDSEDENNGDAEKPRRRRRSRRGGRGRSRGTPRADAEAGASNQAEDDTSADTHSEVTEPAVVSEADAIVTENTEVSSKVVEEKTETEEKKVAPRAPESRRRRPKADDDKPKTPRRRTRKSAEKDENAPAKSVAAESVAAESVAVESAATIPPAPSAASEIATPTTPGSASETSTPLATEVAPSDVNSAVSAASAKPKRRGWWQRKSP